MAMYPYTASCNDSYDSQYPGIFDLYEATRTSVRRWREFKRDMQGRVHVAGGTGWLKRDERIVVVSC